MIRFALLTCISVSILLLPVDAQRNDDRDAAELIRIALRLRASGVVSAKIQTQISRLGDRVATALMKGLDETSFTNPESIRNFLPVIETAFSEPGLISTEGDRKPRATLLLLSYLQQRVPEVQEDAQKTINVLRAKTPE